MSIGVPPTSIMGLGLVSVSSEIRVPKPPAKMKTGVFFLRFSMALGILNPSRAEVQPHFLINDIMHRVNQSTLLESLDSP